MIHRSHSVLKFFIFLIIFFTSGCRSWTKSITSGLIIRQEIHLDGSRMLSIHPNIPGQVYYSCAISNDAVKSLGERKLNYSDFATIEGFSEKIEDEIDLTKYKLHDCKVVSILDKFKEFCPGVALDGVADIYNSACCDVNPDMTPKKKSTCSRAIRDNSK
jgi:hypothetical protein